MKKKKRQIFRFCCSFIIQNFEKETNYDEFDTIGKKIYVHFMKNQQ